MSEEMSLCCRRSDNVAKSAKTAQTAAQAALASARDVLRPPHDIDRKSRCDHPRPLLPAIRKAHRRLRRKTTRDDNPPHRDAQNSATSLLRLSLPCPNPASSQPLVACLQIICLCRTVRARSRRLHQQRGPTVSLARGVAAATIVPKAIVARQTVILRRSDVIEIDGLEAAGHIVPPSPVRLSGAHHCADKASRTRNTLLTRTPGWHIPISAHGLCDTRAAKTSMCVLGRGQIVQRATEDKRPPRCARVHGRTASRAGGDVKGQASWMGGTGDPHAAHRAAE